jgi:hypothetical protein
MSLTSTSKSSVNWIKDGYVKGWGAIIKHISEDWTNSLSGTSHDLSDAL